MHPRHAACASRYREVQLRGRRPRGHVSGGTTRSSGKASTATTLRPCCGKQDPLGTPSGVAPPQGMAQ
jgi:hypothetical protein